MTPNSIPMALTFDDVLLVPGSSSVLPSEVTLTTRLTAAIELRSPLLSAVAPGGAASCCKRTVEEQA